MRAALAASLLALWLPQQTPVFRGSTDVVVVGVQVADKLGAPVEDLTLADFTLKVDGKLRPVVSVSLQKIGATLAAPSTFGTLPDPNPAHAESYVLVVVDPHCMRPVPSRSALDRAADFLDTLPAAHLVGLMIGPARSPQYPFSPLRRPMSAALRQQVGTLPEQITAGEAMALASASRVTLEAGIDMLRSVKGRRTLVLITDTLFLIGDPNAILDRALEADVTVQVVASEKPSIADVGSRRATAPSSVTGGDFGAASTLALRTGGWVLRRVTLGSNVLPRLERLLSARYLLTFNLEASDKDGKSHQIDLKVNRKDTDVTFRKEFVR